MKVKTLRNIITKEFGAINAGTEIDVSAGLGKAWVESGAAEAVAVEKPIKKAASKKETADSKVKKEVR